MAVKIGDKIYRNEQEQVYQNMKDIEELKSKILESYYCIGELNTASIAVARNLTNVPENVETGWLIDTVGNLFKITGSDENGLLIQFYSSIRGPQGEAGSEGSTGPTGPAGYSIRYTSEDFVPGTRTYTKSYIQPSYQLKSHDWIVFKNGYVALISTIGDSTINIAEDSEIELDISGGKSYSHNIQIYSRSTTQARRFRFRITIINKSDVAFTIDSLFNYITDKTLFIQACGKYYDSTAQYNDTYLIYGLTYKDSTNLDMQTIKIGTSAGLDSTIVRTNISIQPADSNAGSYDLTDEVREI
ncbi:MAG: collagen-like protein [Methanobrevibacter sp.]|nr:collagen-like protein [Methanobrevibacter sp.]